MASARKKQEEEHLKILREMVALPHNKHCFDCHQRGPTYINMTIGSFICTSCSGLLRGLNPPHRVKSISMASFSVDEMEFIRSRGNDFCRKVWLGLYDSRMSMEFDTRDENRMREAMSQRYDRKRWYVQPTDAMYEEARRQNETQSTAKSAAVKPLTTLVGSNVPSLAVQSDKPASLPAAATQVQSVQRPSHGSSVQPVALSGFSPPSPQSQQKPASADLLADFSSDSVKLQAQQQQRVSYVPAAADGFADFASFDNQQIPVPQPSSPASLPKPGVQPLMPLQSNAAAKTSTSSAFGLQSQPVAAPTDKYSALADLESVFSATSLGGFSNPSSATMSVNWDMTARGTGGVPWGQPSVVGSAAGMPSYGGNMMTGYSSSPPPPSYANLATAAVANPFVPTMSASPPVVGMPVQSPFMGMTAPPAANYGFYGQPAGVPGTQFQNAPAAMYSVPNGVPLATGQAAYMNMPRPTSVPQQQQFAGWNQPTTVANPFMSSAVPARSANITNPFLS